jgi:hypothetical protein
MQFYRYLVSQSSEFCRHNPLCCFSTSVYYCYCCCCCCCLFRYRLSPETFGYTLVWWLDEPICSALQVLQLISWSRTMAVSIGRSINCASCPWNMLIWPTNYNDPQLLLIQIVRSNRSVTNLHKLDTGPASVNLVSDTSWFQLSFGPMSVRLYITRRVI